MSKKKNEQPLLHEQYPGVYRPSVPKWDNTTNTPTEGPEMEHWVLLPDGLISFLRREGVSSAGVLMVLAIKSAADHDTPAFAQLADDTLAARAGLDAKTVYAQRQAPAFKKLVHVTEGRKRSKGDRGRRTAYDLRPMLNLYRFDRRLREIGADTAEGQSETEATRRRANNMAMCATTPFSQTVMWANSLTKEQIDAELAEHEDQALAAYALIRKYRPERLQGLNDELNGKLDTAPDEVADAA